MSTFSCTKIGNSWYSNSNKRISVSFYSLANFEIYVRNQTRNFEKIKKKKWSWATSFWSFCDFRKYAIYITQVCNSWIRFRVQKLAILVSQIQMGVFQRVFISSQASKYMLENKRKSLRKWKKNWSWATSFWSFGNCKKYAIYIFYIYALMGYSG